MLSRPSVVKAIGSAAFASSLALCGCGASPQYPQETASTATGPAGVAAKPQTVRPRPPTPASVSVKEPGGDADDPQQAALFRQLDEAWGQRTDKDEQLVVPLPDSQHWKRVRYWGVEHFVGFRYGSDHHLLAIGFVHELPPGTPVTSDVCMRRFEQWGRPLTKPFDVKFGPFVVDRQRWRDQPLEVHSVDGQFSAGFSTTSFSAAWAAYPAYRDGCLIYAVAVPWRDHPDLARQVRDRWIKEGFKLVDPKTTERAVRKKD